MKYQAYPEYKDSGVEWLGNVPSHWNTTYLKHVTSISMGQSPSSNDCNIDGDGLPFLQGNAEFGIKHPLEKQYCPVSKKIALKGELLFSVRAPVGALNIANKSYGIGRGLCSLNDSKQIRSEFLWWLLPSKKYQFDAISTGSTFESVSSEQVGNLAFSLPNMKEQTQIANFLDHETAKIDTLINKQQQLIKLLKEKRQAVISHAVTKGLNPQAQMKDSGVEWLGEVTKHWEVSKLKYLTSIQGGYAFNSNLFCDEGIQILRIGNVYQNRLALERQPTFISSEVINQLSSFVVEYDDILMSLTGTLGKRDYGFAVRVDQSGPFLLNQRVAKLALDESKISKDYLLHLLWSETYLTHLYSLPSGTKQANLSNSDVLEIKVALPPSLNEQRLVTESIIKQTTIFDKTISRIKTTIILMQERRTALISAAVTGKIDVRDWEQPNEL